MTIPINIVTVLVIAAIIAIFLIVAYIAVRVAYSYGRQEGLQHPTEEATKRHRQVEDAIKTKRKELADLREEFDLLSRHEVRADKMRRLKEEVVRLTKQIDDVEETIRKLTREIATLQNEAARSPVNAKLSYTVARVAAREQQRLGAIQQLAELRMDRANAERSLVEMADELSALLQTV